MEEPRNENSYLESNATKNISEEDKQKQIDRNKISYFIISFYSGIASISDLAVTYFFKDILLLEPTKLSLFMSITLIPWIIKPLFGFTTDTLPIFGYRRKLYLIIMGILIFLSWIIMGLFVVNLFQAVSFLIIINIGLSFSTVIGEAIVVEISQIEMENSSQSDVPSNSVVAKDNVSLFFLSKYIGILISSLMQGFLVEKLTVRPVFLIASVLPWLLVISGFILIENKIEVKHNSDAIENQNYDTIQENNINHDNSIPSSISLIKQLFQFFLQKFIIVPTVLLIIFMARPSYSNALFYFLTNELKFTPIDFGKISFSSTLAGLIAVIMYKWFFKSCDFKLLITIGTLISFILSFSSYLLVKRINLEIGISDFITVLLSNSFLLMLAQIVAMPMNSLACMLCPKNLEATVYSIFMSALNFGEILSGLIGSILTSAFKITSKDYHNLDKLIIVTNISSLLPLPLLLCISNSYFNPDTKKEVTLLEEKDTEDISLENNSISQK